MKNIFIAIILLFALAASSVKAQTAEPATIPTVDRDSTGIDTLRRIDMLDNDIVQMRAGNGNMVLEVAGYGITLGSVPAYVPKMDKSRGRLTVFSNVEMGFTQLTGVDYSDYAPEQKGFLDQRLGPSFHFSFSIVGCDFYLNKTKTLSLGFGLQYTIDNIRLSNNDITVGYQQGRIVPVTLVDEADKSKIVTSALGIPVNLQYRFSKHCRLTVTAYSDFLLGADAIYKKPKEKSSLSGFSTYQFGLGAAVSYRWVGIYTRYSLTPVFKSGSGPGCHMFSFGFGFFM